MLRTNRFAGKTDLDNLIKFVLDSLNGLTFLDDGQVIKILSLMTYDNEIDCKGRISVSIKEICEEDMM